MSARRLIAAAAVGVLLAAGACVAAADAPANACDSVSTSAIDTIAELKRYDDCRFDRIEAQQTRIEKAIAALAATTPAPSASPSATPTPSSSSSPTKSPTPTLTPTPSSSPSGGGWPNASNTGVPAGTALTTYTGPLTITTAGTIIDAKTIIGGLVIKATGVKITRSKINGTVAIDENATGYSYSITDSTVDAGDNLVTAVGARNFTATRVHVIGGNRSVNCWMDCTVVDSYVHGQMTDETGRAHESGIRMGARGVIRHNTIACDAPDVAPDAGCSAALSGYGDFATVEDMLIEHNLIVAGSGGFCAYGGSSAGKPYPKANRIRFVDNTWQRGTKPGDHGVPVCGYYGPITAFDTAAAGNVWSGNKFDDGSVVQPA